MNSEAETFFPSATQQPKKQRGRPSRTAAETHRQKIERLQAELKEAQEALRANQEKRAAIVGHACLRHARHNTEFSRQFAAMLRVEIKLKADRAIIADLLNNDPSPAPPTS